MRGFSLLIASAFYEIKAFSPYITSLMSSLKVLQEAGIKYSYTEISGDSYVDRAKNTLVDRFFKTKMSHLMIIDSDLGWEVEEFAKVLKPAMHGAEVVGAAYRIKEFWESYPVEPVVEDGQIIGNRESGVLVFQTRCLPGGFIIYSRRAFERTRPVLNTYDMDGPVLEAFRCEIAEDGRRIGEDIYFQRKYLSQGGKMYVVPNVTITHYGTYGYEGNYNSFIRSQVGGPDYPYLIKHLRDKHKGETAWIIGKGPSLQYLKKEDIGNGPVIAINEAIIPVENLGLSNTIYAMQKDVDPLNREPIAPPKKATLLVHEREVPERHRNYSPRYIFDNPRDFNSVWNTPSSHSAVSIADLFGCSELKFIAFDAVTNTSNGTCHYNSDGTFQIEESDTTDDFKEYYYISNSLKKFINHKNLPYEFITPEEKVGTEKQTASN